MAYEKLIDTIMENIGGKENVNSVNHCITRLRFKLKDDSKCNDELLKKADGVVTVMRSAGQYQVVIGNHVSEVFNEMMAQTKMSAQSGESAKGSFFDRMIDTISGVFQPILSVLCAAGMIKGFLALFTTFGWLSDSSGTYILLYTVADGLFYYMPLFLAYTASVKFGLDKFIGMGIGAALVYPSIMGAMGGEILTTQFAGTIIESDIYLKFLGIPVIIPQAGYVSSVIPVIVSVAAAAPIEKFFRKKLPKVLVSFFTPFFTLAIIVPIVFIIIGPITTWSSQLIGAGVMALYDMAPVLAGAVVGAIWQPLVIFGLHWGLVPIAINNILTMGRDPILAWMFGTTFAQTGAVIAVMLKTKDKKLKSLSIPAVVAGLCGITEAAIYGVTLPRIKTFIASCASAAITGGIIGALGYNVYINGGLGVFGYPSFINPDSTENHLVAMIGISALAFVLGLVLSWIVYKEEDAAVAQNGTEPFSNPESLSDQVSISSPMTGAVLPLNQIDDDAFASGAIGKGIAIDPADGKIYAPMDGEVAVLIQTKHAICIRSADGVEIMIHIGMDTVQLGGKYFEAKVAQGDFVKKGDLLMEVDFDGIKKEGYSVLTPVIITNYLEYLDIINTDKTSVRTGDELLYVIKDNNKALVKA